MFKLQMLYYLLLAFLSCIAFQLMFLHFYLHHPVSIILAPVLKAWVKGSTWIPIFDVENTFDAGTIPRKVTNFMMGGWWSGVPTLSFNKNLFWVQGGLEAAEEEDLEREGPQPFKFASIGGISEFLGWTDQQRAAVAKEGWGYRLIFSARLVGIFIVADALFIGAQQVGHYLQDIRSH